MTKKELVKAVAEGVERQTGKRIPQTTIAQVADQVFIEIAGALERGETTRIEHFGSFFVKTRKARPARHPKTGETIQLNERRQAAARFSLKLSA